jgi:hypothetical protein
MGEPSGRRNPAMGEPSGRRNLAAAGDPSGRWNPAVGEPSGRSDLAVGQLQKRLLFPAPKPPRNASCHFPFFCLFFPPHSLFSFYILYPFPYIFIVTFYIADIGTKEGDKWRGREKNTGGQQPCTPRIVRGRRTGGGRRTGRLHGGQRTAELRRRRWRCYGGDRGWAVARGSSCG